MYDVRSDSEEYELPSTIEARRLRAGDRQEFSSSSSLTTGCGVVGGDVHRPAPAGAAPLREYRPVTAAEQDALERSGCTAQTWTRVYVAEGFYPASCRNVAFGGTCSIGTGARLQEPSVFESDVAAEARIDCGSTLNGAVVGERARSFGRPWREGGTPVSGTHSISPAVMRPEGVLLPSSPSAASPTSYRSAPKT